MSSITRSRSVRAVALAGLVAVSPAVAACGGGSSSGAGSSASSVTSVAKSVASSALSAAPTSSLKSAASSAASAASGALTVGKNVNLTGTVGEVFIPGGYLFTLTVPGQSKPVPVGTAQGSKVKAGDQVTVQGTVASVNVQQLEALFGSKLNSADKAKLQQLSGSKIVNATKITAGGSS